MPTLEDDCPTDRLGAVLQTEQAGPAGRVGSADAVVMDGDAKHATSHVQSDLNV